jgi:hypothetical protein
MAELISLASQPTQDTLVVWFVTTEAKNNKRFRQMSVSRKRTIDEVLAGPTAQSAVFPLVISDEMMDPATSIIPRQDALVAQHWIVQATPAQLAKVRLSRDNFLRTVIPPGLDSLTRGKTMTARETHEAIEGLLRLSLSTLPLELRLEVAAGVLSRMPSGIRVFTVPTNGRRVAAGDGLSRVSLAEFAKSLVNPIAFIVNTYAKTTAERLVTPGVDGQEFCSLLAKLIAEVPQHYKDRIPEIRRVHERLSTGTHTCPICFEETTLGERGLLLPCCTGIACDTCIGRCHDCPYCRTPLQDQPPLAMPAMPAMPAGSAPLTLQELAARTDGLQPPPDTLQAIIRALQGTNQARRILIFASGTSRCIDLVQCELAKLHIDTVSLTGRVTADKDTMYRYLDMDDVQPLALLCKNDPASVTGLDLGCTDAVVVAGGLSNPSQLVARVVRPRADAVRRGEVPLVMID